MPNRYICSVFEEMRDACKTLNFSYMMGLIEEAQSLANRMESALGDKNEVERRTERLKELKEEKRKLTQEIGTLKEAKKELEKK